MLTLTETKRCNSCGDEKLLEEFRLVRKGSPERRNDCNLCHARYQRRRRIQRRRKQVNGFIRDFNEMERKTKNYHKLAEFVAAMCDRMGGVDKLADAAYDAMETARYEGKTHITTRWLIGITKMMLVMDTVGPEIRRQQLNDLNDEDLNRAMAENIQAEIAKRPQLAVAAAAKIGWTVIPPGEG